MIIGSPSGSLSLFKTGISIGVSSLVEGVSGFAIGVQN